MENKSYWFITVLSKLEEDSRGWCVTGSTRCWGFYSNKEDALNALHKNITDLWEYCYDYAVLEEYHEGISNHTLNRQFFKYDMDKDGYVEIEEPECVSHICGFALG